MFFKVALFAALASAVVAQDVPSCVTLCLTVKEQEAGTLAPACATGDRNCYCGTGTYVRAYETYDNCANEGEVATGRTAGVAWCAYGAAVLGDAAQSAASSVSSAFASSSVSAASEASSAAAVASSTAAAATSSLAASASSALESAQSAASSAIASQTSAASAALSSIQSGAQATLSSLSSAVPSEARNAATAHQISAGGLFAAALAFVIAL